MELLLNSEAVSGLGKIAALQWIFEWIRRRLQFCSGSLSGLGEDCFSKVIFEWMIRGRFLL